MKTLRRETSILSACRRSSWSSSVPVSPSFIFYFLMFWKSINLCTSSITFLTAKLSGLFQDLAGFYGNNICLCVEEFDESAIKANNNDQCLWVSIMYQAHSKYATRSQGIMKHFRRLRLTEVKWFAEGH